MFFARAFTLLSGRHCDAVAVIPMALLALLPGPGAAADGAAIYAACVACHGDKGQGNASIGAPNIAGSAPWYVERQLENFANGRRGMAEGDRTGALMRAPASALAGDARQAVARYVAGLAAAPARATSKSQADLKNGATRYNALCSACHAARGTGNAALGAPSLVGIDPAYLGRQFDAFKRGWRGNHPDDKPGRQMAAISRMLPDAAAERDVLAYIATLGH